MNRRTLLFIVAGALLAVVVYLQVARPSTGRGPAGPTPTLVPVVVAKQDIPPYTLLGPENGETKQLPAWQAVDTLGGLQDLVGRISTTELRKGNIIKISDTLLKDRTWVDGQMLVFSIFVPTARVVGGQLRPGHHVDVLVTRPQTSDETRGEGLWLARNLWVVGVQQSSGEDVLRPPITVRETTVPEPTPTKGGSGGGVFGTGAVVGPSGGRQGPANLVQIAAHREIAKMIGDYLGVRLFEPWVYIRPAEAADAMTGQINGKVFVVFEDPKGSLQAKPVPVGIDGVTVRLEKEGGGSRKEYASRSGGKFAFEGLEPGSYTIGVVANTVPQGYSPSTPSQLGYYVAGGQNLHIEFGYTTLKTAVAVAEPSPTPKSPVPSPPAVITPGPTPAVPATPTPVPTPRIVTGACACVTMSDRESGVPMMAGFPKGTREVWAVVVFESCPQDMPYSVLVLEPGGHSPGRVIASGNSPAKAGKVAVPIKVAASAWGWSELRAGGYVTILQTGPERTQRDMEPWSVSEALYVTPQATKAPACPPTGAGIERQR